MKITITVLCCLIAFQSIGQVDITTTRLINLLRVRNQAEFDNPINTLPAGEAVRILDYSADGYFTILYKGSHEAYVYYPYFSEVEGIQDVKAGFLKGVYFESTPNKISVTTPAKQKEQRTIHTGPRGGRYYINSKGNKVYVKD